MKKRIFSIMDMGKKKAGLSILCGALMLTLGSGMAAKAETKNPPEMTKESITVSPQNPVVFLPNPDIYAKYADFGITISEDGTKLLYKGMPVRLFADDKTGTEAFYFDGDGNVNLSVIRNAAGEITEIQRITEQKAQEYQNAFLAEEGGDSFMESDRKSNQEEIQNAANKYDQYKPYGITYSAAGEALYFNGQRVKLLFDRDADGWFTTSWTDDAGTLNLEAVRDASGQITGIESISDEKAQKYMKQEEHVLDGLEERIEERVEQKMEELYPED